MYVVLEVYEFETKRVFGPFSDKASAKIFANNKNKAILEKHYAQDRFNSCPWSYEVRSIKK